MPATTASSRPPTRHSGGGAAAKPEQFPQARAQRTRNALLEAAHAVFSSRGYDAVQSPEISARAGVSTGSFYRYFKDKRAIFVEMLGRYFDEANARVLGRLTPALFTGAQGDHREAIDTVLGVLFDELMANSGLERAATEMALRDPEVASLRDAFDARGRGVLAAVIGAVVPRSVVPDPRAAAMVIHRAGLDVAIEESRAEAATKNPSRRAVRLALREMIHRYLFPAVASASARPAASPTRAKRKADARRA